MDKDKNIDFEALHPKEEDFGNESSTRARNRTVMLTPEITGQVRARLQQDMNSTASDINAGFNPPNARVETASSSARGGGFIAPSIPDSGGTYVPAGRAQNVQNEVATHVPKALTQPEIKSYQGGVVWSKETPVVGFLVSFDTNHNGDIYELRSGRLIVTSEPATGGSYIVLADPSVSPMHAILRISASGEVQVLDQLSEFGTHIKRFGAEEEEHISGEKSTIEHGDIIKFGNRVFHVCILAINS